MAGTPDLQRGKVTGGGGRGQAPYWAFVLKCHHHSVGMEIACHCRLLVYGGAVPGFAGFVVKQLLTCALCRPPPAENSSSMYVSGKSLEIGLISITLSHCY